MPLGSPKVRPDPDQLRKMIGLLDLTSLSAGDTPESIRALCRRALAPRSDEPALRVAGVCVYPALVSVAAAELAGSGLSLASVAGGFPDGQASLVVKMLEAADAVANGASEIDLVINRGAALSGDLDLVWREIRGVRDAIEKVTLKVILETGQLADPALIRTMARLAIDAGADFLKTSTGAIKIGATPEAVDLLAQVAAQASRPIGIKPAGGISTVAAASALLAIAEAHLGPLDATRFRFGASGLLNRLLEALEPGE
jgi:deoxyribose-phosphate aldolase